MKIEQICERLKNGAKELACHTTAQKNASLQEVARCIEEDRLAILKANEQDVKRARMAGMSEALVERLSLSDAKITDIIKSLHIVINQTDPVGEDVAGWTIPNGLQIRQVRVPIGVVAIIYESRPNVTVDAFCLAYKSGNAILLRGSSSALESNKALTSSIMRALQKNGVPEALALSESANHDDVSAILNAVGQIDLVIPRGGKNLIQNVVQNSRVPVIETGSGVCHLFVDESANLEMAVNIAENAKTQRPGACNAIECILVSKKIAKSFLSLLAKKIGTRVLLKACSFCFSILKECAVESVVPLTEDDYGVEFLDFVCNVCAVESLDEAIAFINKYGTKHSECIVTNNREAARIFQKKVDASCVYVNASTRFTDGGEFGFGAELGISTQKMHARGPMGVRALTTTKYLIDGDGQVR